MGANSAIQWCDHTFNAVEGCEKVSAGCRNCYAEARNNRFSGGANWGPGSPRLLRSPSYWLAPKKWNREAEKAGVRRRVFAGSLCDVCEDHPDWIEPRRQLAQVVLETPWLDWLFVTKRPENYRRMWDPFFGTAWPRNVWAGCTVEDRDRKSRIGALRDVPAAVRFLSIEPLIEYIGAVDWTGIHWGIIGGESGHGARPFDLTWARSLIAQMSAAGVACFLKQLGSNPVYGPAGTWHRVPLRDSHGGNETEWPADLQGLRAFPAVRP